MRISGIHHLAIQVRDIDRVCAFYRDVLGLEELVRQHSPEGAVRSVWLTLPSGGFLALEKVKGEAGTDEPFRSSRAGYLLLALRIARGDRASIAEELSRRGVAIEHQTR